MGTTPRSEVCFLSDSCPDKVCQHIKPILNEFTAMLRCVDLYELATEHASQLIWVKSNSGQTTRGRDALRGNLI